MSYGDMGDEVSYEAWGGVQCQRNQLGSGREEKITEVVTEGRVIEVR